MDIWYIKETAYNKNKAEAYYLVRKKAIIGIFLSNYLHNYVNRVQYTVVKAIILF